MSKKVLLLLALNLMIFNLGLVGLMSRKPVSQPPTIPIEQPILPKEEPINYTLKNPIPAYLSYNELVAQLKSWVSEAPKLAEVGTYGKSIAGKDLVYFHIRSPKPEAKPAVLITGAIHGNESWSTAIIMGYIGTLLDQYGDDESITEIINTRELYFVPIVSPDTYPDRREVEGVDPNRDFPTLRDPNKASVKCVQALREFFLSIRPCAAISGHTFGRVYLQPYGDSNQTPPHQSDYTRIVGKMAEMSQYGLEKASHVYRQPIKGTEVDWYYRHGAFAIVAEYGTHQKPPSQAEIVAEFNRTFRAILYFLKESPKVHVEFSAVKKVA